MLYVISFFAIVYVRYYFGRMELSLVFFRSLSRLAEALASDSEWHRTRRQSGARPPRWVPGQHSAVTAVTVTVRRRVSRFISMRIAARCHLRQELTQASAVTQAGRLSQIES